MLRLLAGKRRRKHQINSARFPRTKEAEGDCLPNDLRSLPTMRFPHAKFKRAQQVDSIKRMVNGFTGFSSRPEHLRGPCATITSAFYASATL